MDWAADGKLSNSSNKGRCSYFTEAIASFLPFEYEKKISDAIPLDNTIVQSSEKGNICYYAKPTNAGYNSLPVSKYSALTPVEHITCPF